MEMAQTELSKSIPLESRRVLVQEIFDPRIGQHLRSNAEFQRYQEQMLDRLVYRLESFVLSEKLVEKRVVKSHVFEHKVRYPRSWWQHFKQDVLDRTRLTRWFVNWKPVKYKTEYKREHATLQADFRQYATFPAADILTPPSIHHHLVVPSEELDVFSKGPK